MSNITPNDGNDQIHSQMFEPISNDSSSTTPNVDLNALQATIHTLDTSTTLDHALAPHQTYLLDNATSTTNAANYQAAVDVATSSVTQTKVVAALNKAGITVPDIFTIIKNAKCGIKSTKFTTINNILNKVLNFKPNGNNPNSKFIMFNLFYMSWGLPRSYKYQFKLKCAT
jgi:hypothetical protein